MMQIATAYFVSLTAFLLADYIWLSLVARKFYWDRLSHLLADQPNLMAAAGFYAVYVVGIVMFAILPAIRSDSATMAILNGAAFGFFAYATYDMTNYATLKNWPLSVVLVDVAWGTFLTGGTAIVGYLVTRYILGS